MRSHVPAVKIAILSALTAMLDKCAPLLRPFQPQLGSTFTRALQEPASRPVRIAAAAALAALVVVHMKGDSIVMETAKIAASHEDAGIR